MSNNATSRNRGLDKGPTKTSHVDSNKHKMRQNQKSTYTSNSKLTSNGNNIDDNNSSNIVNTHQSTPPVATQEQLRIAQLLGNRHDDPEVNEKIKQVLDIVPNKNQDDVLMILHENDYDVSKTIEYLLDGGDMIQEWTTIGKQAKKQNSPNQNFDDSNKNQRFGNRLNKPNSDRKEGQRVRGDKQNNRKYDRADRFTKNENGKENLEDKFVSMNLEDDQKNQTEASDNPRRGNNFRGGARGGRGAVSGRGGREFVGDRGERTAERFERSNGRGGFNNNITRGQTNRKERQVRNDEEPRTSTDETNSIAVIENMNPLESNSASASEIENSLRDIGTWSNEQAAPEPNSNKKRSNNSNQRQQPANNRFPNTKSFNNPNTEGVKLNDNEENEEEWQGDLTQTQIFTASNQVKKEETNENSDFPIGHFNTEEAAQKIKSAIGIVTMNSKSTTKIADAVNTKSEEKPNPPQPIKLGSVKPPPPSTKIPKSAVVMPGGNTNGYNLDFSFGVDMETHSKKPETPKETTSQIKPTVQQQITVSKVPATPQQVQVPLPQRQKEQVNPISQLNAYEAVKALSSNEGQQKIGVVNPVVSNKNTAEKTDILNNLPLESNTVSSVLASLPKVDLTQINSNTSSQSSYLNQQQQNQAQQNKQQSDVKKSPQESNFINDSQKQQKQFMQFHQQQQQQNLNMQKSFNDQPSKVVQNTQQLPASQSATNGKPYINQLNQEVSSAVNLNNINATSNHSQHNYQLSSINNNSNQMKQSTSSQNISSTSQSSSSQLLNQISPQNSQKQGSLNPNSINSSSVTGSSNKSINTNGTNNNNTMPPPPGVNMINPNNQFIMGLPFQQQFPYFDPSQMDANNIMQMYNHLAGVAPPGVGSVNDTKFNRSQDSTGSNSQLNPNAQLSQQQQPMNMIPGLSNFPFFFHNYYPNMFMSMPQNGGPQQQQQGPQQQQNPQQFQSKPPYNFNNNSVGNTGNGVSDYETKDYNNYNPQSQMKTSGSNINNVSDISGYQKNADKSNTGYHTPPPNYSNSLNMNQQQPHPNVSNNSGAPLPPTQYAYMTSMIGTPATNQGNLVNPHGMQQDMNSRVLGNNGTNSIKQLKATNYQNSPWS